MCINNDTIRVFGVIPLREEHKLFNLYKTFALTRTTPVGGFIQYDLANEDIAISPKGQTYTRLPDNFRTLCNKADVY